MFRRRNSLRSAEDELLLAEGSFTSLEEAVSVAMSEENRASFAFYKLSNDSDVPSGTLFILLCYDGAQGRFPVLETVSNAVSASQSLLSVIYLDRLGKDIETVLRDFSVDPRQLSYFPCTRELAVSAIHMPLGRALDTLGWSSGLAERAHETNSLEKGASAGSENSDVLQVSHRSPSPLRSFRFRLLQIIAFIAAFFALRHLWKRGRPMRGPEDHSDKP